MDQGAVGHARPNWNQVDWRARRAEARFEKHIEEFERQRLICGATSFAKIIGKSNYGTYRGLLRSKTAPPGSHTRSPRAAAQMGKRLENEALERFETKFNTPLLRHQGSLTLPWVRHPEFHWLATQPDGITLSGELIEVKVRTSIRTFQNTGLSAADRIQCQVGMEITGLRQCWYVEYLPEEAGNGKARMRITRIYRNPHIITDHLKTIRGFMAEVYRSLKENECFDEVWKRIGVPGLL